MRSGRQVRGGTYAITEDIAAVDTDGSTRSRQELSDRWEASQGILDLFVKTDWSSGVTTTILGAGAISLLFGLENEAAAWMMGWVLAWSVAIMDGIGTFLACRRLERNQLLLMS